MGVCRGGDGIGVVGGISLCLTSVRLCVNLGRVYNRYVCVCVYLKEIFIIELLQFIYLCFN